MPLKGMNLNAVAFSQVVSSVDRHAGSTLSVSDFMSSAFGLSMSSVHVSWLYLER